MLGAESGFKGPPEAQVSLACWKGRQIINTATLCFGVPSMANLPCHAAGRLSGCRVLIVGTLAMRVGLQLCYRAGKPCSPQTSCRLQKGSGRVNRGARTTRGILAAPPTFPYEPESPAWTDARRRSSRCDLPKCSVEVSMWWEVP